jgi:hypothetical protein
MLIPYILKHIYVLILECISITQHQPNPTNQFRKTAPKMYKYLRKWKYHLARLNDRINLYFKEK